MNPLPIVWASLRRNGFTSVLFVVVVALVVAFGKAISAQERALRSGSVRAADKFDLIVAAPGSFNDVLLSTVYLNPSAVELLDPAVSASLLAEPATEFVAPIGFGGSIDGAPLVGTIAPFVEYLSGGLGEGRMFAQINEAVVGALAPFSLGDELEVHHRTEAGGIDADAAADALEAEAHDHEHEHEGDHHGITVVGRMLPTGTPWDRASVVPIEYDWEAHGLGTGHTAGDMRIGPPFEARPLPGIPAMVVKPRDVAAAYGLRGQYRTEQSTAFFPAEVLVGLYAVLGDVTVIMGGLTLASQGLVMVAAILAGIVAILDLQRQRFAVLRALGASPSFICHRLCLCDCTGGFRRADRPCAGLGSGCALVSRDSSIDGDRHAGGGRLARARSDWRCHCAVSGIGHHSRTADLPPPSHRGPALAPFARS